MAGQGFTRVADLLRNRDRFDPFDWIRDSTDAHRLEHHCWAYPFKDGTVLGALVRVLRPKRVLELGCALGYTACWWAGDGAWVDTIDNDPIHVRLARENVERAEPTGTVTVHEGSFDSVLSSMQVPYDLVFFDGYEPPDGLLDSLAAHLRPHGTLVTTNLDLGSGRVRAILSAATAWNTHFVDDIALSVRS